MPESRKRGAASATALDRWATSSAPSVDLAAPAAPQSTTPPSAAPATSTPPASTPPASSTATRGVREGSRRQTLDLPADDYRWLHDLAADLADEQGIRRRDLSAQHLLRAAVMLMRPGQDGDPWHDFRIAVREQAQAEALAVAEADRQARDAARAARDQARATQTRMT